MKGTVQGVEFIRDTFVAVERLKVPIGVIQLLRVEIPSETLTGVIEIQRIKVEIGDE